MYKWGDLLKINKQEQLIGIYAGRQHTNHVENNKHSQHHHKNQTLHGDTERANATALLDRSPCSQRGVGMSGG